MIYIFFLGRVLLLRNQLIPPLPQPNCLSASASAFLPVLPLTLEHKVSQKEAGKRLQPFSKENLALLVLFSLITSRSLVLLC